MEFKVAHRAPMVTEYNELRALAGWPVFESGLVEEALQNSLCCICIELDGMLIAMGRIVGDNAIYLHIQDVIVHPRFQRKGVGKLLMRELMTYIGNAGGMHTNVGLMCSKGREKFYRDFGFEERPSEKFGAGMILIKPGQK